MTTRLKGKGRGTGRGRATAPDVAGQNLSDRPWCGPDVPHGFVDQRIEEGKSGVEITKAIGHHFEARPRTIKPGTEGIRVVRASTNDQVDPSANVRYKNLWLCNGFDDVRNSGAQPEYYADPKDKTLFHALSGGKRNEVWEYLREHHPNHRHVKSFEGFKVWCYNADLAADESTQRFIVWAGNNLNSIAVGATLPDRLEAAMETSFVFGVCVCVCVYACAGWIELPS